jgi:hypothetical protein
MTALLDWIDLEGSALRGVHCPFHNIIRVTKSMFSSKSLILLMRSVWLRKAEKVPRTFCAYSFE